MNGLADLFTLAWRSARYRRASLLLLVLSMAVALSVLIAVQRVGEQARGHFSRSVSAIDLIAGPRSSPLQLVLTSVFRIGESQQTMAWSSFMALRQHPDVKWAIPVVLGDSVEGFPVMATDESYFQHFRHGDRKPLSFAQGRAFSGVFDVVLGAGFAAHEGLGLGDHLVLDHGHAGHGMSDAASHGDKPFVVVGILEPTGTAVDQTVHITLQGFQAIHLEWQGGAKPGGFSIPQAYVQKFDLSPKRVNAALIGLHQRTDVFAVRQFAQSFAAEPLTATLPALALDELWRVLGVLQAALTAMSVLIGVVSLSALLSITLASVSQRRRELAILRSVGAAPGDLLLLLAFEGLVVSLMATALALVLLLVTDVALAPWMRLNWGFSLDVLSTSSGAVYTVLLCLGVAFVASLVPGVRAYRFSLQDGLMPRS
jgi:putative ABC transport system permease protein